MQGVLILSHRPGKSITVTDHCWNLIALTNIYIYVYIYISIIDIYLYMSKIANCANNGPINFKFFWSVANQKQKAI